MYPHQKEGERVMGNLPRKNGGGNRDSPSRRALGMALPQASEGAF